ncbi:MAG: choice-of-anchor C family protein [Gammaproteobacteria bacterium]|nr:choice-of-anchor C family protein [Gammaproteobacteria bacterium]MCG3145787.1 hypothetical protein [Gammaproteobacteria bacterium]
MKLRTLVGRLLVAACLGLSAMAPAHANLVLNGSFETPIVGGSPFVTLNSGSLALPNWAILGSIDHIGSYWQASDGNQSIDLNGYGLVGTISQSFATTPGQLYELTFDMAGNPDFDSVKTLLVQIDSIAQLFNFDSTGKSNGAMGWVSHSLVFTATDALTTLMFQSLTFDFLAAPPVENVFSFGPALDNVAVNAVPVPAAVWLLGSALLGLGMIRRRKAH